MEAVLALADPGPRAPTSVDALMGQNRGGRQSQRTRRHPDRMKPTRRAASYAGGDFAPADASAATKRPRGSFSQPTAQLDRPRQVKKEKIEGKVEMIGDKRRCNGKWQFRLSFTEDKEDQWATECEAKKHCGVHWAALCATFQADYYTTEKSGETPNSIADRLGLDVEQLLEVNKRLKAQKDSRMRIGTTLSIRGLAGTGSAGIARTERFEASSPVQDIAAFVNDAAASAVAKVSAQAAQKRPCPIPASTHVPTLSAPTTESVSQLSTSERQDGMVPGEQSRVISPSPARHLDQPSPMKLTQQMVAVHEENEDSDVEMETSTLSPLLASQLQQDGMVPAEHSKVISPPPGTVARHQEQSRRSPVQLSPKKPTQQTVAGNVVDAADSEDFRAMIIPSSEDSDVGMEDPPLSPPGDRVEAPLSEARFDLQVSMDGGTLVVSWECSSTLLDYVTVSFANQFVEGSSPPQAATQDTRPRRGKPHRNGLVVFSRAQVDRRRGKTCEVWAEASGITRQSEDVLSFTIESLEENDDEEMLVQAPAPAQTQAPQLQQLQGEQEAATSRLSLSSLSDADEEGDDAHGSELQEGSQSQQEYREQPPAKRHKLAACSDNDSAAEKHGFRPAEYLAVLQGPTAGDNRYTVLRKDGKAQSVKRRDFSEQSRLLLNEFDSADQVDDTDDEDASTNPSASGRRDLTKRRSRRELCEFVHTYGWIPLDKTDKGSVRMRLIPSAGMPGWEKLAKLLQSADIMEQKEWPKWAQQCSPDRAGTHYRAKRAKDTLHLVITCTRLQAVSCTLVSDYSRLLYSKPSFGVGWVPEVFVHLTRTCDDHQRQGVLEQTLKALEKPAGSCRRRVYIEAHKEEHYSLAIWSKLGFQRRVSSKAPVCPQIWPRTECEWWHQSNRVQEVGDRQGISRAHGNPAARGGKRFQSHHAQSHAPCGARGTKSRKADTPDAAQDEDRCTEDPCTEEGALEIHVVRKSSFSASETSRQRLPRWIQSYQARTEDARQRSKVFADAARTELCRQYGPNAQFKPLQLDAILACQAEYRDNVVVHMETGGGKTLIYHLLARLNADCITIVIVPLVSLKEDACRRAQEAKLKYTSLLGGDPAKTDRILDEIAWNPHSYTGGLMFLTAEMFDKKIEKIGQLSKNCLLGRIVIDEAHYGTECDREDSEKAFRPAYRRLGPHIRSLYNLEPVLCLTASMNKDVVSCLACDFDLKLHDQFLSSPPQSHLSTHVITLKPRKYRSKTNSVDDLQELVKEVLEDSKVGPGLIFCLRQSDTERVSKRLNEAGVKADYYHAGRSAKEKEEIGANWRKSESTIQVLCATPGFGLGIDKSGICFVHHLQLPLSMAALQQQLGRARATPGEDIKCIIWHNQADQFLARRIMKLPSAHKLVSAEDRRRFENLQEVNKFALETHTCLRQTVVKAAFAGDAERCLPCNKCSACLRQQAQSGTDVTHVLSSTLSSVAFPELHDVAKKITRKDVCDKLESDPTFIGLGLPTGAASKLLSALMLYKIIEQDGQGQSIGKGKNFASLGPDWQVSVDGFEKQELSNAQELGDLERDGNHEVEMIISRRIHHRLEYKVRWAIDRSETWEPVKNLGGCPEKIAEFNKSARVERMQQPMMQTVARPPASIEDIVDQWSPLTSWLVHHLISIGELLWMPGPTDSTTPHMTLELASNLYDAGDDLSPLKEFLCDRWRFLPAQGSRFRIQFSAEVKFVNGSLKWTLNWPEHVQRYGSDIEGETKRIYCKYGSANILSVKIPQNGELGSSVAEELTHPAFVLNAGGRQWWKPKAKVDTDGHRLIFYAKPKDAQASTASLNLLKHQRGYDCNQCSICLNCKKRYEKALDKVRRGPIDEWHISIKQNEDKTVAKLLSRVNLLFSSQVPTVQVENKNVVCEEDYLEQLGETKFKHFIDRKDGTCGIAPDLLKEVWMKYLDNTGRNYEGFVPSMFQGRLGAYKGTWSSNPALPRGKIFYRKKQEKFNRPYKERRQVPEGYGVVYDEDIFDYHSTIEVCRFFEDAKPAGLNKQIIAVLEPRMQDPEVLVEILQEHLEKKKRVLVDPGAAEEFCRGDGHEGSHILEKIKAGFGHSSELVQSGLVRAMTNECKRFFDDGYNSKIRIPIAESVHLPIIPDEHHLLEEGEILVMMPKETVYGRQVLLARNPCYDPGELLLQKCVDPRILLARMERGNGEDSETELEEHRQKAHQWYSAQKCCIIMSVRGERPLGEADKMSGGDYDGDCVIAIWDERITNNLRPCQPLVYSVPPKNHLGSRMIGSIPQCEREDKIWEYFLHLIRRQSGGKGKDYTMSGIAECSMLHEAFADLAAKEETDAKRRGPVWQGKNGRIARILADFAHKAVDMDNAGYDHDISDLNGWLSRCGDGPIWQHDHVSETTDGVRQLITGLDLQEVQKPEYCLSSTLKKVFVANFPRNLNEAGLRRSFRERYDSVCDARICHSKGGSYYGFVSFADEEQLTKALKDQTISIEGCNCKIQSDTTARTQKHDAQMRPSTSVIARLWETFSAFEQELRSGRYKIMGTTHLTTDKEGFICRPASMEADTLLTANWLTSNAKVRQLVRQQYLEINSDFSQNSRKIQDSIMRKVRRFRRQFLPGTAVPINADHGALLARENTVEKLAEEAVQLGVPIKQILDICSCPLAHYSQKNKFVELILKLKPSRQRNSQEFSHYCAAWYLELFRSHKDKLEEWGKKTSVATLFPAFLARLT